MTKRDRTKQDRAWKDYSERFRRVVLPKIMSSAVSLTIHSGDGADFDVRQATELGAMLLLDKPLIVVCVRGSSVPSRLRKAADAVIEDWDGDDPDCQERITAALEQVGALEPA